jgi:hypothetical protein
MSTLPAWPEDGRVVLASHICIVFGNDERHRPPFERRQHSR